jgi:hypothetical protein
MDIIKFVDGMLPWLKKEVNSLLSPLENRLSTLEKREIVHGKDGANGRDGIDGKDVDVEFIKTQIFLEVAKLPIAQDGKDGADGKDGKDADPEYIKSVIAEEVSKVPAAKDGKDADIAQVKAFIVEEVAKIPVPQNGKDVDLGEVKELIREEIKAIEFPKALTDVEVKALVIETTCEALANVEIPKEDGVDGSDGKDALDIAILPAIDEAKSVPRGTYAAHKNGLWKSYQKTVGMKGWECIVAGIADISIEMPTDRSITIKTVLSNGETQVKTFETLNTVYKGVYEVEAEYVKGDLVTWGGSIWHCNEPTNERPREGHKSWTLAVKKGRDYREPVKNDFDPNKPVKMQ